MLFNTKIIITSKIIHKSLDHEGEDANEPVRKCKTAAHHKTVIMEVEDKDDGESKH